MGFPYFPIYGKGPAWRPIGSPELRYKNISFVCRFYYITSRTMLIERSCPSRYWLDCFTYNRTPPLPSGAQKILFLSISTWKRFPLFNCLSFVISWSFSLRFDCLVTVLKLIIMPVNYRKEVHFQYYSNSQDC